MGSRKKVAPKAKQGFVFSRKAANRLKRNSKLTDKRMAALLAKEAEEAHIHFNSNDWDLDAGVLVDNVVSAYFGADLMMELLNLMPKNVVLAYCEERKRLLFRRLK